eukprot:CAMPEP_0172409670 /NCGR_PEP_ID=MMETSP1061-20121228/76480_1 /TAXON_ID=37318 /ORGANISM="Pseudo-nitzschia pungens, Strain cf. pungens" /LENGTH=375 /DNA_ID=CAMNT_0013145831 /DNA_START=314 /DNA_END=1441 /DNA_ORIENTATION=-
MSGFKKTSKKKQQGFVANGVSGYAAIVFALVFVLLTLSRDTQDYVYSGMDITPTQSASTQSASPANSASTQSAPKQSAPPANSAPARQLSFTEIMSMKPLKSLHADWKTWEEMNPSEQDEAIKKVGAYMTKYGKLIEPHPGRRETIKHGKCELVEFDNGHALCGPPPPKGCSFFSFGINDDPSFDQKLAETWGCRGFAGDPSVHHPSKLHPKVTFHNVGASMLQDNEERLINKGGAEEWWSTSMTKLRYWLGLERVEIIKMDCEGCEFALAKDIITEDPTFLFKVDQISIETHVSKAWLTTREHFYYFALHFVLLEEAGFELEWSQIFGCSKRHEVPGCVPELEEYGFPCGYDPWPGHPSVVLGRSCHDFLWKRY